MALNASARRVYARDGTDCAQYRTRVHSHTNDQNFVGHNKNHLRVIHVNFSSAKKLTQLQEQGDLVLASERRRVNISDWLDRKLRNSDDVPFHETSKHDPRRLAEYDMFPFHSSSK
jgi:hypothetical protein